MMNYKKQLGIWLDYTEAFFVSINAEKGGAPEIKRILSNIDMGVAKGGSRSKTPWGPQGGMDERKVQDRRHREEKDYFEAIIRQIDPELDELMIFGPAEAKHGLQNSIESIKHFHPQLKGVFTSGPLTQNQLVAYVRQYFAEKVEP